MEKVDMAAAASCYYATVPSFQALDGHTERVAVLLNLVKFVIGEASREVGGRDAQKRSEAFEDLICQFAEDVIGLVTIYNAKVEHCQCEICARWRAQRENEN